MSALVVAQAVKGLNTLRIQLKNIDKYSKAAGKATNGKDPFPPPKKVQAALKKLKVLEADLKRIAKTGLGAPPEVPVSLPMLADPKTKPKAVRLLLENLIAREALAIDATKLIKEITAIQKDANVRAQVANTISNDFAKLVKSPLPDVGTVGKTTYLQYHLLFQKAAGVLSSVGTAAGKGLARIKKDKKQLTSDTKVQRANFKTFGVL